MQSIPVEPRFLRPPGQVAGSCTNGTGKLARAAPRAHDGFSNSNFPACPTVRPRWSLQPLIGVAMYTASSFFRTELALPYHASDASCAPLARISL